MINLKPPIIKTFLLTGTLNGKPHTERIALNGTDEVLSEVRWGGSEGQMEKKKKCPVCGCNIQKPRIVIDYTGKDDRHEAVCWFCKQWYDRIVKKYGIDIAKMRGAFVITDDGTEVISTITRKIDNTSLSELLDIYFKMHD
jgi:hypothetical protein